MADPFSMFSPVPIAPMGGAPPGIVEWLQQNPGMVMQLAAGMMGGRQALPQALANMPAAMKLDSEAARRKRQEAAKGKFLQSQTAMAPGTRELLQEADYGDVADHALKSQPGRAAKYGVNPFPYTKTDGSVGYAVVSETGDTKPLTVEDGRFMSPAEKAGTAAGARYDAQSSGKAREQLPALEQTVKDAEAVVGRLTANKTGIDQYFGWFGQKLPTIPGTPKGEFEADLEQATGLAFMKARNALKGGGQITDYEGQRAETAITVMAAAARSGSKKQFLKGLEEFNTAMKEGLEKMRAVAREEYSAGSPRLAPGDAAAPNGNVAKGPWQVRQTR